MNLARDVGPITEENVSQLFDHFSFDIVVPENAGYSDKECMERINKAAQSKDCVAICQSLQPFYNSPVAIEQLTNVGSEIFRLLWNVDKNKIVNYLNNNDWSFKMEAILFTLKEYAQDLIPGVLNSKSRYPAARLMSFFVKQNLNDDAQLDDADEDLLKTYCELVRAFIRSYKDVLKDLKYSLGITYSQNFNYLMGMCSANFQDSFQIYLPLVVELSDKATISFSKGFMKCAKPDTITRSSWTYMDFWRNSFIHNYDPVNKFCGLEMLWINGLCYDCSSKEHYLTMLKDIALNVDIALYSWNKGVAQRELYLLFFVALANKQKKYVFENSELKRDLPILFDKRYYVKFGEYVFETMLMMLTNPERILSLELKDASGGYRTLEFKSRLL